ncbi:MAG TPA: heat-shock protein Hsp20 [Actinobacteria bacterium]|nr:heat-shock protein Hsp20 [Actinomycetota bacterium]
MSDKYYKACCDIYEKEGRVFIELEMPGVSKDNLEVKIDNDLLIINGTKKINSPEGYYLLREIRQADYHHEYTIDYTIDRNRIEASLNNGIAAVSMGIKESEKPRKITITS